MYVNTRFSRVVHHPFRCTIRHLCCCVFVAGVLWSSSAPNRQTVINDVAAMFENKSVEELAEQKTKIQDMLNSGEASVDSEYWEAVLKELHVFQVSALSYCKLDIGCRL